MDEIDCVVIGAGLTAPLAIAEKVLKLADEAR